MKNIHWGIIGCGDVCEVKSGPAFYKIQHSALTAVMRRDLAKAEDFARRHNASRFYDNADQLIADPDVNAIYVATPPAFHKEYAIKAMRAGKPVYVEKPMAMNYAECLEMIDVSNQTGQKLFVAYYRRALPYFVQVKELLEKEAVGKVLTVNVQHFQYPQESDFEAQNHTWRIDKNIAGGGYFYDLASHTLDMLDFLLGEIIDVKGYTANMGQLYEVEDTVSAAFVFESGIQATAQWSFVASETSRREQVEIIGTKGSLKFNIFGFKPIELTTSTGVNLYEAVQPEHIQQPLISLIVDELRGHGKSPSNGITAARTSKVIDLILGK